jgi:phosphopantetheinyl transferase
LEVTLPRDADAALDWVLGPAERDWLRANGSADPLTDFYRAWTLKEALGKSLGLGWQASSAELDIRQPQGRCGHLMLSDQAVLLGYALPDGSPTPTLCRLADDGSLQPLPHRQLPWPR